MASNRPRFLRDVPISGPFPTSGEGLGWGYGRKKIWQQLRLRNLEGNKFRRQHPIGNFIVDFVCIEKKLIVELDGGQHQLRQDYDSKRTDYLEGKGYKVLRFWDNDALLETDSVMNVINEALKI